jgi:hypothetical protein
MNWNECGRMRRWPNLCYHPDTCLEVLRKTKKDLIQDTRSPSRDSNSARSQFKSEGLSLEQTDSIPLYQLVNNIVICIPVAMQRLGKHIGRLLIGNGSVNTPRQ